MTNKKIQAKCYVNEDELYIIDNNAKKKGLSRAEYIKLVSLNGISGDITQIKQINKIEKIIQNNTYLIDTDDLYGLLDEIRDIREKINGIYKVIIKSDKIYSQDIINIYEKMEEIEDLLSVQIDETLNKRKKIKKEVNRILKENDDNKK